MKELKEIIDECNLTFKNVKQNYKTEYDFEFNREKEWLKNLEDKTHRLTGSVKSDIDYVISKLKSPNYLFSANDSSKLSTFVSQINGIVRIANRINNFKEGAELDNGRLLVLFDLFNTIKRTNKFSELNFGLNKNLNSFIVHLFSIIKHCQNPNQFPVYYKYWKNILGEVLKKKDDYDSLCEFYKTFDNPKHVSLGAYMGAIGTILAHKLSKSNIIKEENDKNYKYIKSKILNIHYFDLIIGYMRKPNYFIIGSKYGENNDIDMFQQMRADQVISVGFASHLDLNDFYLSDENEIIEYLKEGNESQSSINALKHFLGIKIGDKIAVKASGSPKGNKGFLSIVGICEVVANEEGKVYSYDQNNLGHRINVKYLEAPIYREYELGGYGSTVHHLSKIEHIDLIFGDTKSLSAFEKVKSQFERHIFDSFIDNLREILKRMTISINDERVVFSVREKSLNFTVGQRYCFNLYASESRGNFGVISKNPLHEKSEPFNGGTPPPFYNYLETLNPTPSEWESIIESIKEELSRSSRSGYRKYNNIEFENYVFENNEPITYNHMNFPLNTILYGPPGTGKTYHTILRAAEIIENKKIDSYQEALQVFNDNLHNRIEFITFHQNYSYEDFIQGLRPETDNKSSLTFDKKDGVFKRIADKAKQNSYFIPVGTTLKDYRVIKSNDDIVELFSEKTKSVRYVPYQLIIDLYEGIKSNKITLDDIKKRKDLDLPHLINSSVEKYYFGIEGTLYNICEYLIENEQSNSQLNYVIIIDEINRANISRVFGELITLIEPDKRSHGDIPLEVKLPSGDHFVVPSNLYIIGTMNTADKSIALLDIALRRRFEFESMYPMYEIEGAEIYDKDILLKLNEQIIKSKGHDFQIGHAYFMGENKDLVQRMNKKVIPLLLEYFMNDDKEVKGILYNAGLQIVENSWPLKISGKRV
ncbi:AAA family ATPase [Aquirufa sp. HETE-83D]|uniref:AAA family ATPase n=1 Tax=Aquirufa esocilacus TaxID=3096513 RepID=A0ABW6DJT2_9BACT